MSSRHGRHLATVLGLSPLLIGSPAAAQEATQSVQDFVPSGPQAASLSMKDPGP